MKQKLSSVLVVMLIVALLPTLFSATTPSASANPGWWDPVWTARDNIHIIGAHPENFQIRVMLPFFDNSIRFLENDDAGVLPYWVESSTASSMTVWVRRLENADDIIYVYYGNAGVGLAENGDNTFILFDNFDTLNNWTQQAGTWTTTGGIMTAPTGAADYYLRDNTTISEDSYKIEAKIKGTGNYYRGPLIDEANNPMVYNASLIAALQSGGDHANTVMGTADWVDLYASFTVADDTWYILGQTVVTGANTAYAYTTDRATFAETATLGASSGTGNRWGFFSINTTSVAYAVDWIFVRKYTATEPTIIVGSVNSNPVIVSVTSSVALVDRKQDVLGSGVVLSTLITARIQDNNGQDNMTGARIAIRDSTNAVVENADVWVSRVSVDENTWDVSYTYNPSDALANASLGNFDVWVYVTDNYWHPATWYDTKFVVDDVSITVPSVTPENATLGIACGDNITVAATASRVSGAISLDNSWVVDDEEGTFYTGVTISVEYTITNGTAGQTVTLGVRAIDFPLDGYVATTYTITENCVYNWCLLYEENAEPFVLKDNRTYTLNIIYQDGTGVIQTLTVTSGQLVTQKALREIYIRDGNDTSNLNDYVRTLVPRTLHENLKFLLIGSEDIDAVTEYTFTLEDYTGSFGIYENGIIAFRKMLDSQMTVTEDFWGLGPVTVVQLIRNTRYQIDLYGKDNAIRVIGWVWAASTYSQPITVRPVVPENIVYVGDYITWAVWRENQFVKIVYYAFGTDNVTINIYTYGTDNLETTTGSLASDNVIVNWDSLDNSKSYTITLDAWHSIGGHLTWFSMVDPNWAGLLPPATPGEGTPELGLPVALMTLASLSILGIIGLTFGPIYVAQSMFAIVLVAWVLKFLGWLQGVPDAALGIMFVISVIFLLGRSK